MTGGSKSLSSSGKLTQTSPLPNPVSVCMCSLLQPLSGKGQGLEGVKGIEALPREEVGEPSMGWAGQGTDFLGPMSLPLAKQAKSKKGSLLLAKTIISRSLHCVDVATRGCVCAQTY